MLTAQGPRAPGGQLSYLTASQEGIMRMTEGFAVLVAPFVATPNGCAFAANHRGQVYWRRLGSGSDNWFDAATVFDPDSRWALVSPR
ncbi:MAG: DUF2950 family protein [Planctomycetota bacterium]|nr:DUF2950 family protein [Planctomycetota bacterium]